MARRFRPHAHTCGTSSGWLASIDARLPEANVDLDHLQQDSRSVIRQAATTTCAVAAVEARPVRVRSGGGQWARKVAGRADHLQPSGGHGRVRHRAASEKVGECVRKKVKISVCLEAESELENSRHLHIA